MLSGWCRRKLSPLSLTFCNHWLQNSRYLCSKPPAGVWLQLSSKNCSCLALKTERYGTFPWVSHIHGFLLSPHYAWHCGDWDTLRWSHSSSHRECQRSGTFAAGPICKSLQRAQLLMGNAYSPVEMQKADPMTVMAWALLRFLLYLSLRISTKGRRTEILSHRKLQSSCLKGSQDV